MRKKRAPIKNHSSKSPNGRNRFFISLSLTIVLLLSGASFAWWGSPVRTMNKDQNSQVITPNTLQAGTPSKEYIYAGSRLVAAEQRALISPTSMSFPANGGTDSVAVTVPAGFNWSAQSNDAWIRITSGGNGLGPGEVSYTVDPRNDPQSTTTNRSGTITIAGSTFTVAQGVAFTDVDPTDPFYNEIGKLSARGVTLGCGGGQYCDTLNVNREQMAAFIIRAVGLPNPPAPPFQRFMDVSPLSPFYRVIDQMAVKQITLGCGGNNYCPTEAA